MPTVFFNRCLAATAIFCFAYGLTQVFSSGLQQQFDAGLLTIVGVLLWWRLRGEIWMHIVSATTLNILIALCLRAAWVNGLAIWWAAILQMVAIFGVAIWASVAHGGVVYTLAKNCAASSAAFVWLYMLVASMSAVATAAALVLLALAWLLSRYASWFVRKLNSELWAGYQ